MKIKFVCLHVTPIAVDIQLRNMNLTKLSDFLVQVIIGNGHVLVFVVQIKELCLSVTQLLFAIIKLKIGHHLILR